MNTWTPAAKPPGWQRVLACAAVWLALWPLTLAHGVCPPIIPTGLDFPEMEPNNSVYMAGPWPVMQPLVGEQGTLGDPDFFYLDGLAPDASFQINVTPDTFNPRICLWALRGGLWQLQQDVDQTGVCEAEQLVQTGWDPCQTMIPVERYALQVSRSLSSPNLTGSYRASVSLVSSSVPLGDCCQYPIAVPNGLNYSDTQNTGAGFRDMGFGSSPDVWYQLVLDQSTVLTAQTCGGLTNFDTVLRVVAADCSTVLAVNDNSARCAPSLVESWLSATLDAGSYYVVVEGAGSATGSYTLTLRQGSCPGVVPGPGSLVEFEPNDEPWLAQPWPVGQQLYGEQTLLGDADFFALEGVSARDGVQLTLQPDTFDPLLRLWGLSGGAWLLLAESNAGGMCEAESVSYGGWDPCSQLVPIERYCLEVAQHSLGAPAAGAYLAGGTVASSSVPLGDCCQYPISVPNGLNYSDTQNTGAGFRDIGFGSSPDVWYQLVLDQSTVLTAQTCGGSTNFDTVLRVVDDDCSTVLAVNDNSARCAPSLVESWLSATLDAGTYYVVVEGSGTTSGSFTLTLRMASCPAVVPSPGALHELEPNDEPWLAQPWPVGQQLYGEQFTPGDVDYFRLVSAGPQDGFELTIQPDTFDPVVRVYSESAVGLQLVAEVDNGGVCEMESVTIAGWDPCTQLLPITGWIVGVSQGMAGPAMGGAYLGSALAISSSVPVGDCCQYPIAVGSLPFTDNRNTSVSYRDMGFGPSPDVWYQLVLEQGGVLTAQTCGGQSNFDTMLRVVDDDCVTVLASNDNSLGCGAGSVQSWLSTCLTAGTYYVVVEGTGTASGLVTLSLALRPSGAAASLVAGGWSQHAEPWHQRVTPETTTLWLLADDDCDAIDHVTFRANRPDEPTILLGTDWDGTQPARATLPQEVTTGDGWFLAFDSSLLGSSAGPVQFTADLHFHDGSLCSTVLEGWYSPNLSATALVDGLERWEKIRGDHYVVSPGSGVVPGTAVVADTSWKSLTWSRGVPPESQRGISDTYCSPTAYSACLEWLDQTYGTNVCGGLQGEDLARALGGYMGTDGDQPGTMPDDERNGLERWIADHGGGYTVHNEPQGTTNQMANQAESKGQDVVAALKFSDGAWHMVTMSSFNNVPQPNGNVMVDFMDPWTGSTQIGSFNPSTGAFSGYGDGNTSGQLKDVTYVCPTEGTAGGDGGRLLLDWQPWDGPIEVPIAMGTWWLRLVFQDPWGKSEELFAIIERVPPEEPVVVITLLESGEAVRLGWSAVPDAVSYNIYRNMDGYFDSNDDAPYATVTGTSFTDPVLDSQRWCYKVTAVYAQ